MDSQDLLRQDRILKLLREDREQGAELLLETYTPLLWTVCGSRLSNPEDIRECINDVFTKFCLNLDQYDPQQSSLKNYLAMMADRRAISYYRSNQRRNEAEASTISAGLEHPPELTQDLEEALASIPEEDAQIIRLKYYGGMTYGEIAAQMGITEAAAKKRGARSLKKLAKWLIIGLLIAALLAGCAYVVYCFRYARGMGIVPESETAVYQLAETVEPICANGMEILPLSVTYLEDSLLVQVAFLPTRSEYPSVQYNAMVSAYDLSVSGIGSASAQYSSDRLCEYTLAVSHETLTPEENGSVYLELTLSPTEEGAENVTAIHGYNMDMSALSWTVILNEVAAIRDLADLGYYLETTYTDFLVMTDWELSAGSEEDHVLISLSPLRQTDGYTLSSQLSTWYSLLDGRERELITLTDDNGNSYPVVQTVSPLPNSSITEFVLWFDDLPSGEYTLSIPSLCYQVESEPCSVTLPLPQEDLAVLDCDETVTLPDGTCIHITGITRQTEEDPNVYIFPVESWEDGVENWILVEDTVTKWHYSLSYEVITDGDFSLAGLATTINFSYQTESGLSPISTTAEMHHSVEGLDYIVFGFRDGLGMKAPDAMTVDLLELYYIDPQDHSIRITIP